MTEASKARAHGVKRPMVRVVTMPDGYTPDQLAEVRAILKKPAWIPAAAKIEFVDMPKSTPPRVVTSGVSCRMGVGGRRGRKREPARLRFWRARARDELRKAEKLIAILMDPRGRPR